jgi:NADP-dependent 3-hydroxy acid dehydrogenase YdfG
MEHSQRPAVVTGASSGIGAATAIELARLGHPVVLGARRTEKLEETATAINEAGGRALAVSLDVRDTDSVQHFAASAVEAFGEIEIVISNAGGSRPGWIHSVDTDPFMDDIDLNIGGAHRIISAFVPGMVARASGDVVFISSDVAVRPRPVMSAYAASKWGLEGMVNQLQMELEGTGVRASVVRPGPTHSEMGMDWDPELTADVINTWTRFGQARHGRFLKAEAIARAIAAIVTAPPRVHMNLIEVSPVPPVDKEKSR